MLVARAADRIADVEDLVQIQKGPRDVAFLFLFRWHFHGIRTSVASDQHGSVEVLQCRLALRTPTFER